MNEAIKIFLAVVGVASCANLVDAAGVLTIYDGTNPIITVQDNGAGDQQGATGVISVSTNIGVWNLSISSALTKPVFGSAVSPIMEIIIQAQSSASGTLTYTFTDNGFGPIFIGSTLNSTLSGGVLSGAGTAAYNVFGDAANVLGATTTLITSIGTSALPVNANSSGVLALPTPFSLTQIVILTATGASYLNADASFNVAVPEPGCAAIAALGLAAVLATRRKRAKA